MSCKAHRVAFEHTFTRLKSGIMHSCQPPTSKYLGCWWIDSRDSMFDCSGSEVDGSQRGHRQWQYPCHRCCDDLQQHVKLPTHSRHSACPARAIHDKGKQCNCSERLNNRLEPSTNLRQACKNLLATAQCSNSCNTHGLNYCVLILF